MDVYAQNHILPMQNLIITYETRDNPLDPSTIQKLIREFFF